MFSKYGMVLDKLDGVIKWQPWPHLRYLIDVFNKQRLIIIMKSRQVGVTWLAAAYALHKAMFSEGANVIILSKGEDEASEELGYARFIHQHLPDWLRISLGKDQAGLLTFPSMQSKIRAIPSTKVGGIGFGAATLILADEFEFHPFADENYSQFKPMVDAGGQLIIFSNVDKTKPRTKFKELYKNAMAGSSQFFKIFIPYNVLPWRTQEWYDNLKKDYLPQEIEGRYPRTEQEALELVSGARYFDQAVLSLMYQDCFAALKHPFSDKYPTVSIYRLPVVGRTYTIYTDPSDGKYDPHAIMVIDASTGEQVAESHGMLPADEVAVVHHELVLLFNNAYNSFEKSGHTGGLFAAKMKDLHTPNQAPTWRFGSKLIQGETGQWAGNDVHMLRMQLLDEAIRRRQIIIRGSRAIEELATVIISEGKPLVPRPLHDDLITAWAGVIYLRQKTPSGTVSAISFKYKGG